MHSNKEADSTMKEYLAPEFEYVRYTEDCLVTSDDIPKETDDIGGIINDLL